MVGIDGMIESDAVDFHDISLPDIGFGVKIFIGVVGGYCIDLHITYRQFISGPNSMKVAF